MSTTRRRAIATSFLIAATALTGVASTARATTTPDDPSAPCDATVPGTQIDYGTFAPTPSLDPTMVSGGAFGGTEMAALYDVLMVEDPETGEILPNVAESFTPNDDFTEWTLVLPADLAFPNGDPFDAANVIAHLDRFNADGVRHAAAGWFRLVTSTEALDEHTVVFTTEKPWASFPSVFTREPGMVINTRLVDSPESLSTTAPEGIGIGPFTVEEFAPGEALTLVANPGYWRGPVCVEHIRFTSIGGAQATYDSFLSGDLDIGHLQDPLLASIAQEDGNTFVGETQESGLLIMPNHRDGTAGADIRVREAMMLALDEEIINSRTYDGVALTSRSLVPPESKFFSDEMAEIPLDPERAAQLVEEAKADGFDGILRAVGQSVPPFDELMLSAAAQLEAVGFEVDLELLPTAEFVGKLVSGDFDIAQTGLTGLFVMNITTYFHSDSPANRMGLQSEAMDAAIDELLAAPDLTGQQAALATVNDIIIDESIAFPVAHPAAGIVVSAEIDGIRQSAVTTYLLDGAVIEE